MKEAVVKFARSRIVAVYIVCVWILPAHESSAQLTLPGNLIVSVTSPSDGSKVSNTITVEASVSPLGLVAGVQFKLDGADLGAEVKAAPYSTSWDTVRTTNGVHKLTAVARNILDVRFTSDPVRVTVFNDKTPPTVTITSPANGTTVFGTVTVSAMATDNVGVAGVQFKLDGVNLGAEFTTAPYSISWDTTTSSNRSHILSAVARDAAGNQATATVNVVVFNDTTPPTVTITSPANGTTVFGTVTVSAMATDNVGVAGVQFKLDGVNSGAEFTPAPNSISCLTAALPICSHILSAVARDAAGNQATATVNVVVFNDTTPPTVSITFPTADSTVFGLVNVTASASDNGVVAGVQFRLDGDDLGVEATAAPYAVSWDTTRSTNGSHTLTAIARDGAGNRATSGPVVVKV